MGKARASTFFAFFPLTVYALIGMGIILNMTTIFSLISLTALPLIIKAGRYLRHSHKDADAIVPAMSSTVKFSRLASSLPALSFLLSI